ncbi:hypothetical protein GCM10007175_21140 [Pseudarthrobacter scleromae]|uniref:Uncharacterized protein n=1 Tax=Pseudarthrobacter scleromae TaxID=158897 RepID=A0ABQ2CH61_9MICC|nr:hypothetical protein GCM10007175_21140 [Pseudarthrobacter scleromae]
MLSDQLAVRVLGEVGDEFGVKAQPGAADGHVQGAPARVRLGCCIPLAGTFDNVHERFPDDSDQGFAVGKIRFRADPL